jgi:hypothetical protein
VEGRGVAGYTGYRNAARTWAPVGARPTGRLRGASGGVVRSRPGDPVGIRAAPYLTRLHDRLLRTGLAQLTNPDPPASNCLRRRRAYQAAIDDLARQAGSLPKGGSAT